MKRLFAQVLALSVGVAWAEGKCFFRPGDTWVPSGDSITYIGLYRQTVKDALDHFGFNIVFCDDNAGNMELFPIMGYKGLRYLTPEQRLNQTIIVDRKGDVPQVEGIFDLRGDGFRDGRGDSGPGRCRENFTQEA